MKYIDTRKRYEIVFVILILIMCIVHSVNSCCTSDFIAINGTFQNYNVVRRLLSGQLPYKDFAVYLGLGHLYLGSIVTAILGGSFQASLAAFSFLTIITFCLISVVLGKMICGRKSIVPYIYTLFILIILIVQPIVTADIGGIPGKILQALSFATKPMNSARFIRGLILPITIVIGSCLLAVASKRGHENKARKWLILVCYSAVSGIAFLWSNDYGLACYLCLLIMLAVTTWKWTGSLKDVLLCLIFDLLMSSILIISIVFVLTGGEVGKWLAATFGVGGYQGWYYGLGAAEKSFYVWDIDFSFLSITQAVISLYYLIRFLKDKDIQSSLRRYGIPAYTNMACFAVINEIKLLSYDQAVELAYTVLFLDISYEVIEWLSSRITVSARSRKKGYMLATLIGGMACVSLAQTTLVSYIEKDRGDYVEGVGYLTELHNAVNKAKSYIGDEKIFSTYASALELATNQFQPSGIDYIIHAMGDSAREKYMESFRQGNFKYATTIRTKYSNWEFWIRNANWFFYRELFQSYKPVWKNKYQIFWEKDENNINMHKDNIDVQIIKNDEQSTTIRVETDSDVTGIADVLINYKTHLNGSLSSKFVFKRMVEVENKMDKMDDQYHKWTIRESGEEYIPIPIVEGVGEIVLNAMPQNDVCLDVNSAQCDTVFIVKLKN